MQEIIKLTKEEILRKLSDQEETLDNLRLAVGEAISSVGVELLKRNPDSFHDLKLFLDLGTLNYGVKKLKPKQ